jgi:protein TonB
MSYLDQPEMSTRKMVAIVLVVILHVFLGYAFITGLAFNVVKKVVVDLKTFDVQDAAPPPPPPPPDIDIPPPPVAAPPPIVQLQSPPPPMVQVAPPPPVVAPPPPPAPPPVIQPVRATPRGKIQDLITTDDYPSASLRNNEEGTTSYRLDVGADGKVVACTVTASSGHPALDDTSCRLLQRRARFNAATDSSGAKVGSVYSGRVRWQIPKD